ncbi:MAG TPA: 1,6-anhydro-N-acetylmuramyl-L-alanine amidase AmpD [Cellvibrionaceae bacterium]
MVFQVEAGIIQPARWVPSPNYSARSDACDISLLIVHNISLPPGEYGGGYVGAFFQNQLDESDHPYFASIAHLQVSAHCFIDRAGAVTQFVNLHQRAWHAGASFFAGRENCNDFSIGIELEGTDDEAYSQRQYETLAQLAACIMAVYPAITPERIVGHSDVAPGRKTDPGDSFDWDYFCSILSACLVTQL